MSNKAFKSHIKSDSPNERKGVKGRDGVVTIPASDHSARDRILDAMRKDKQCK